MRVLAAVSCMLLCCLANAAGSSMRDGPQLSSLPEAGQASFRGAGRGETMSPTASPGSAVHFCFDGDDKSSPGSDGVSVRFATNSQETSSIGECTTSSIGPSSWRRRRRGHSKRAQSVGSSRTGKERERAYLEQWQIPPRTSSMANYHAFRRARSQADLLAASTLAEPKNEAEAKLQTSASLPNLLNVASHQDPNQDPDQRDISPAKQWSLFSSWRHGRRASSTQHETEAITNDAPDSPEQPHVWPVPQDRRGSQRSLLSNKLRNLRFGSQREPHGEGERQSESPPRSTGRSPATESHGAAESVEEEKSRPARVEAESVFVIGRSVDAQMPGGFAANVDSGVVSEILAASPAERDTAAPVTLAPPLPVFGSSRFHEASFISSPSESDHSNDDNDGHPEENDNELAPKIAVAPRTASVKSILSRRSSNAGQSTRSSKTATGRSLVPAILQRRPSTAKGGSSDDSNEDDDDNDDFSFDQGSKTRELADTRAANAWQVLNPWRKQAVDQKPAPSKQPAAQAPRPLTTAEKEKIGSDLARSWSFRGKEAIRKRKLEQEQEQARKREQEDREREAEAERQRQEQAAKAAAEPPAESRSPYMAEPAATVAQGRTSSTRSLPRKAVLQEMLAEVQMLEQSEAAAQEAVQAGASDMDAAEPDARMSDDEIAVEADAGASAKDALDRIGGASRESTTAEPGEAQGDLTAADADQIAVDYFNAKDLLSEPSARKSSDASAAAEPATDPALLSPSRLATDGSVLQSVFEDPTPLQSFAGVHDSEAGITKQDMEQLRALATPQTEHGHQVQEEAKARELTRESPSPPMEVLRDAENGTAAKITGSAAAAATVPSSLSTKSKGASTPRKRRPGMFDESQHVRGSILGPGKGGIAGDDDTGDETSSRGASDRVQDYSDSDSSVSLSHAGPAILTGASNVSRGGRRRQNLILPELEQSEAKSARWREARKNSVNSDSTASVHNYRRPSGDLQSGAMQWPAGAAASAVAARRSSDTIGRRMRPARESDASLADPLSHAVQPIRAYADQSPVFGRSGQHAMAGNDGRRSAAAGAAEMALGQRRHSSQSRTSLRPPRPHTAPEQATSSHNLVRDTDYDHSVRGDAAEHTGQYDDGPDLWDALAPYYRAQVEQNLANHPYGRGGEPWPSHPVAWNGLPREHSSSSSQRQQQRRGTGDTSYLQRKALETNEKLDQLLNDDADYIAGREDGGDYGEPAHFAAIGGQSVRAISPLMSGRSSRARNLMLTDGGQRQYGFGNAGGESRLQLGGPLENTLSAQSRYQAIVQQEKHRRQLLLYGPPDAGQVTYPPPPTTGRAPASRVQAEPLENRVPRRTWKDHLCCRSAHGIES